MAQEVRAVVWQLEGCWFNPSIAPHELVGTLHGSQSPLVCECVCEWVNERHKLIKALYKCSPFVRIRGIRGHVLFVYGLSNSDGVYYFLSRLSCVYAVPSHAHS